MHGFDRFEKAVGSLSYDPARVIVAIEPGMVSCTNSRDTDTPAQLSFDCVKQSLPEIDLTLFA